MEAHPFHHFRSHRGDLEIISSNLHWTLNVFNLANPNWRGCDYRLGNRLFFVCRGNGSVCQENSGAALELRPGFACFIPRNVTVRVEYPPELVFYALEFHVELLPGLDLFSTNNSICEYRPAPEHFEGLREVESGEISWKNFFRFEKLRQSILLELLDVVEPSISYRDFVRGFIKYARLIDFIRNEASARTTMNELAAVQKCTYDKLSRMFRADFGMSLKKMLDAELSMQAKSLLTATNFSIKEIARRLEFSNEYNFSRFFKRINHCAPRAYRLRYLCAGPFPQELKVGKHLKPFEM